jgi:hypothetical protein
MVLTKGWVTEFGCTVAVKTKVAVSVPFRILSAEIKRLRGRALYAQKGIYLKRKLLLHACAGTALTFSACA